MSIFDKESIDKAARATLNPFNERIPQEIYNDVVESVSAAITERQYVVLEEVLLRISSIKTDFTQVVKAVDAHISGK